MQFAPTVDLFADPSKHPRPHVRFETRTKEVRGEDGNPTFLDEVWVRVTPPGSRDCLEKKADDWVKGLEEQANGGRIPPQWPHEYARALIQFKEGQELPVHGTALKNWPTLTSAQRANIERAEIRTVEELAAANDEAKGRIGMGAERLVQLAKSWIAEASGPGGMASKIEVLSVENERLRVQNTELLEKVATLETAVRTLQPAKEAPVKPGGQVSFKG